MWLLGALKIIVLLGTLITIHELGHFFVARLFKVKVLKFAIGFGPKVFTKTTKNTEYTIRLIPFGGFVQMEGEEQRSEDENAFNKKPIWQRLLIVAAGAIVNILFALLIYFCIISANNLYTSSTITNIEENDYVYSFGLRSGDEILKVNNKRTREGWKVSDIITSAKNDSIVFEVKRDGKIKSIKTTIPQIRRGYVGIGFSEKREIIYIEPESPAEYADLMLGDIVVGVNGETKYSTEDVVNAIRNHPNEQITITILRNSETYSINVDTTAKEKRFFDLEFVSISPGFFNGIIYALDETKWYLCANFKAYGELFTGNTDDLEVMGVVGVSSEISKTKEWEEFFYYMCAISLSLGIFNLMPIPALDGGRIILLLIEGIRRKPMKEKLEQNIILIGFAIILVFGIIITIFDIQKLL